MEIIKQFSPALRLNGSISRNTKYIIYAFYFLLFVCVWQMSAGLLIRPFQEIFSSLHALWFEKGFSEDIGLSLRLNITALAVTLAITLTLSYLAVWPAFRPISFALSKGRFLGLMGLTVMFIELFGLGFSLKVSLLTFGTSVFYITSMYTIVTEIPESRYDYARALGLSEVRIFWHVVIRGTADQMLEAFRQNAAIGWMMITTVEGIVKAGGIGDFLWASNRKFDRSEVLAIIFCILLIGILQDIFLRYLQRILTPHTATGRR